MQARRVSFALGKADADSLLSFAAVLKAALDLKGKGASEVNVLYEDMKVCADGLEQDYELARKKGVNFLKYTGEFQIPRFPSGIAFKYREPFLSDQAKIVADYIVLAEDFVPAAATQELAEILDIRTGPGASSRRTMSISCRSNRTGPGSSLSAVATGQSMAPTSTTRSRPWLPRYPLLPRAR